MLWLAVVAIFAGTSWAWWRGHVGTIPLREYCTVDVGQTRSELDLEQAANAAVIAGLSVRRGLPARAASIALATAMQESKLHNVAYGDRDSLGLFQQRPSQGWGTAEQVRDPVYATNAFYDVLVKVEGFEDLPITKAAQKVQRSAYPTAYAQHEPEARALGSALTGHSPAAFECILRAPGDARQARGNDGLTGRARAVARAAERELGVRRAGRSDATGRQLSFAASGSGARSSGWALAHWAVAHAATLGIVTVETDGRQWSREHPGKGWSSRRGGVGAGRTVVTVA